jgi:hypothetical protein
MSNDLKKYKDAWQRSGSTMTQADQLNEEEIMDFINNQSRQVTAGYRKGLLFDIGFKALLTFSFLMLAFLYKENGNVVIMNTVFMIFTAAIMILQTKYYQHAALSDDADNSIKEFLKYKVDYFSKEFVKAIYFMALSSPIFFISGGLFYFYFKYGMIRAMDMEDYSVFAIGLTLSFLMSAIAQIRQHKFQLKQLNTCLNDLDEEQISRIEQDKKRNRRMVFMLFLSGIFIFIMVAIIYFFAAG